MNYDCLLNVTCVAVFKPNLYRHSFYFLSLYIGYTHPPPFYIFSFTNIPAA